MDKISNQRTLSSEEFPLIVPLTPASRAHRAAAIAVIAVVMLATVSIAPFAGIQIGRVDIFVPVLQTVLSAADLLTATLLLGQYHVQPHRGLLVVAGAYLFSGSFAFLQTLSFPGGYAAGGIIGDGYNTPAWFFVLWNTTFPMSIFAYALLKDDPGPVVRGPKVGVFSTIAAVFAAVGVLSWTVTAWVDHLPSFYTGSVTLQTRFGNQINVALWILGALTVVALFRRRRTVLDVWLIVTLVAWMPNFLVAAVASSVRFSIGWYAARCFALVASCMLLCVLVTEIIALYSRLANALVLQRRERANQLMSIDAATSAIAHEMRSPLGAIVLNAGVALNKVLADPPNMDELDVILKDIEQASLRADATLTSVRSLLRNANDHGQAQIEDIARQVLRLMQHELQANQVVVSTSFADGLPSISGDRTQLQQLVLNLVKNALEAMTATPLDKRMLHLSTELRGRQIVLGIKDSGGGVSRRDSIFETFFTTKADGMGLGLAICQTIVARHGGSLELAATGPRGSEFEVSFPISDPA